MASSKRVHFVKEIIRKRIAHADHLLDGVWSERELSVSLAVSRTTVRVAIQELEGEGVLIREQNGRLGVGQRDAPPKVIGFLAPSTPSYEMELWRKAATIVVASKNAILRPISYLQWGDPALSDALDAFDSAFLVPLEEDLPQWVLSKIKQADCRVVVVDQDESAAGLPSVALFSQSSTRKLLEHLLKLGHQEIDCINTQCEGPIIQERIEIWRRFLQEHRLVGSLRSDTQQKPIQSGYEIVSKALGANERLASAMICTTGPAAIGVLRALYEKGIMAGRHTSVCAINDEGIGPWLTPSLTCIQSPSREDSLLQFMDWMIDQREWSGPLFIQPSDAPLFVGESTGKPLAPHSALQPA